ncbi:MAG: phosphoadenosine phosphosulfate reductase family protein [Ignisphaera sp.]|uniref:4Fe-4S ferredoxin-type domain-containing protein n=1 Tax=Ignisphaera aggregans TaxID=334771 RepID=A0A7C4NPE0_9CREN
MQKRITWPKVKKIWWCLNCNIPVLQSVCPKCGGLAKRLPLSDPGDARPAFERDYRFLYDAYLFELGSSKGFNEVVGRSAMLLNKAPYYDEMKEVIVDGVNVGRLYFEPMLKRWRFRLSRYIALKLYASYPDVLEVAVVTKKRYMHGDVVWVDRDIERYKQVILVNQSREVVGLGYSKGRGRIVVHSWWGLEQNKGSVADDNSYRRTDFSDVINANKDHIRTIVAQSKKFLAIMYEKICKPVIISFSGGKDSLVALHLSFDLGFEPAVLFNNTGIELPETVETVYRTIDRYGLELVEASAGDRFWNNVYELGVPGRDYRWCCKVCKLAPLSLTVKKMWSNGGLNVVGQRAFESIDRARSPRVWRLRWAPTLLNLSPIIEWSQFEVWLYIFLNSLDVNPLYFMGYERIGCFMCPASTMAELELVSQTHKELWGKWIDVLGYWAKKLELPREWIDFALWRWNAPARYRTMLAKRLGIEERIDDWYKTFIKAAYSAIEEVSWNEGKVRIVLENNLGTNFIDTQITSCNPINYYLNRDKGWAEIIWGTTTVTVNGKVVELSFKESEEVEKLVDILKLYYRWLLCTNCRSCETICPSGAASVKVVDGRPRPIIDKSRCIRCKFCIYNCPVAEVYVEHIVAPIIFSDPEAWRRPTREHHSEVLEKIASFVKSFTPSTPKSEVKRKEESELQDISSFFWLNTEKLRGES